MAKKLGVLFLLLIMLTVFTAAGCRPGKNDSDAQAVLSGEGILVGHLDNQSVEIEINGLPRVFAVGEGVSTAGISEGAAVVFTYLEKDARPLLQSIEAVDPEKQLTGEGLYVGQIDSHSVEIEVDGQPVAFAIDGNVSVEELESGTWVQFTYFKQDLRFFLQSIAVLDRPANDSGADLVGEGILEGQIDAQSVEILLNRVFMIGDEVSIDGIEDGSLVTFAYIESGPRAVLYSIEKVDEPIEGEVLHGTYIGQADSRSVEIEYYKAFALDSGVSLAGIADGAEVVFTYREGDHRPLLTSITKK